MKTNFEQLLQDAVSKPGSIMKAYTTFHNYSLGNQLLALFQCYARGINPGPINTFKRWQELGRCVKKGEKALTLCMPVTVKDKNPPPAGMQQKVFTMFVEKPRWFVLAQTEGDDFTAPEIEKWDTAKALAELGIEQILFDHTDGNCQGYARKRQVAINPVAQLPMKTLCHELGHVVLGHTVETDFSDTDKTPKNLREIEAESVALLCIEALDLPGAEFCRGYIQSYLTDGEIPEKSCQKIFKAANQILKAGLATSAA